VPGDHAEQHSLGQRAPGVARAVERVGGRLLDRGEVVAALAHRAAQRRVGGTRLFRGGGRLGPLRPQFAGEGDEVLQHVRRYPGADPQLRQAEPGVGRVALCLVQADLKLRPAAGWLLLQQVADRHAERGGELLDQRKPGLALAVLDQRQDRRGPADFGPEIGEREALGPPRVPEPLTEHRKV